MKTFYLTLIGLLALQIHTHAQKFQYKFGKGEFPVLEDPAAIGDDAIYLYDEGYVTIEYVSSQKSFVLITERQFAIQILNQDGFEHANIEIPYYVQDNDRESVRRIRGYTYNPENRDYEKTKLQSSEVFKENQDLNHRVMKFAMPAVKVGSIIEVSYRKESPFFFNIDRWDFQHSIPVVHSLYQTVIPEYFQYGVLQRGYEEAHTFNEKTSTVSVPGDQFAGGIMVYHAQEYAWEFRNLPPVKPERYTTSVLDHASSVEMELISIQFPGQMIKNYSLTWDSYNEQMQKRTYFGQQLKKFNFIKDDLEAWKKGRNGTDIPVEEVLEWVHSKMSWNGNFGYTSNDYLRRCYADGEGNVAAMNFLLIGALRELGYEAHPVLLSTRAHGKVLPDRPRMSAYNYVVTGIQEGDKVKLLDASQDKAFIEHLPYRCLNGQFRLQKPKDSYWIKYEIPLTSTLQLATGKIMPDGTIEGNSSNSYLGYSGSRILNLSQQGAKGEERILGTSAGEIQYQDLKVEAPTADQADVKVSYNFELKGLAEEADDLLFLPTGLLDIYQENPFRKEERLYPVDFGYPFEDTQVLELEIPEGYEVESLPESAVVRFPGKKGVFMFQVNQPDPRKILLTRTLIIANPLFFPEEYQGLKEFFDVILRKEDEQIVLHKS